MSATLELPGGGPVNVIALPTIGRGRDAVRAALHEAVQRLDADTRAVTSYHFGWSDTDGNPVAGNGGKSIRSGLALLAAEAVGGTPECALPGAVAVELVHNFSLIHDDLMDRDTTRRHRPTVWAVWGDPTAVLVGDALLALAQEVLLECGSPHALSAAKVLGAATRELIRGQVADVDFERRGDVTLAECLHMVAGKTAALLAASAVLGGVLAGAPAAAVAALDDYGRNIGLAFQLVDDLLGIWGDPAVTGKPVCNDLRARKKSLPITWTLENGGAAGRELARWLTRAGSATEPPTEADLRAAAALVERGGGRAWATTAARRHMHQAEQALESIPIPSSYRGELVDLAHFVVERSA
jgi:geranylgeranyl diphosphate synthase type I